MMQKMIYPMLPRCGSVEPCVSYAHSLESDLLFIVYVDATGADTTVAAIRRFFLVMCRYPDVQRKAQQELDSVVGPDRLPVIDE